ncbi:LPS export ABC transporter periplasmic protein LptC [Thiohalophilus thiocyanatoxydans]|uniref:Lipopolysaccharide export system protein LptC n=1 Tax=Thiohalophilus thiocyanatoxydans TaxID=381308 RepID=A0A4R8IPI8_9GAMM|nr:LPS export ABC transporter periplasmic protein LptC [Thiohalophilus thiocyanatoxydans]TDY01090.1 lipopolysaccharide export system protein LptC [Thiohalophilus thiocyanatoxydans]
MNKLQVITIILLVILIGAFSNWLLTDLDTQPRVISREVRHDPDYYLENFTATSMGENGVAKHRLVADYLEHYPDDDSVVIQQLTLDLFRQDLPPWTAQANQGVVYEQGERVELSGEVELHRPATDHDEALTLLTEKLTVYPQREYAETDAAVTITSDSSETRAIGMQLDVAQGLLELLSDTRGTYVINPR